MPFTVHKNDIQYNIIYIELHDKIKYGTGKFICSTTNLITSCVHDRPTHDVGVMCFDFGVVSLYNKFS